MANKSTSPAPISCKDGGWALVYALIFCVIIQGMALATCSIVTHNLKSGNIFKALLLKRHAPDGTQNLPAPRVTLHSAPEGWDNVCFTTEVTERQWENESSYTWRVGLRQQPAIAVEDRSLFSWRPHVILLVDDSRSMLASSGHNYNSDRVYREYTGEEINPSRSRDDFTSIMTVDGGSYFRGDYGNASKQAADIHHYGGTMQCWTYALSCLTDLVEDLDLCSIAIATVSGGIIQPFTTDRKLLHDALRRIRPRSHDAKLSEALLGLTDRFPDSCCTSRHIVVATAGIAVNDGNIASSIRDFDNDGDTDDRHFEEEGCRCLDDVAAYAYSRGIRVHAIGPETNTLIRATAQKGHGVFGPSKASFELPASFLSQMPALSGMVKRLLPNTELAFGPDWLSFEAASYSQLMANGTPHLGASSAFAARGAVCSLSTSADRLFCTTSRDDLFFIDMATGVCSWACRGPGGKVGAQGGVAVAGPNIDGDIMVLNSTPEVVWSQKGELFSFSSRSAYITDGSAISSYEIDHGIFEARFNTGSPIRILEYEPASAKVMAGTESGMIYLASHDLSSYSLLSPELPGGFKAIRSFHLKNELHVIAVTDTHAACLTPSRLVWKVTLGAGKCINALVMDSKLYLTMWTPGECGGMDSGNSSLEIRDAKTGDVVSQQSLFESFAFGPLVDLQSGTLEFSSWSRGLREVDINSLPGVAKPLSLGSKLKRP